MLPYLKLLKYLLVWCFYLKEGIFCAAVYLVAQYARHEMRKMDEVTSLSSTAMMLSIFFWINIYTFDSYLFVFMEYSLFVFLKYIFTCDLQRQKDTCAAFYFSLFFLGPNVTVEITYLFFLP